MTPRPDHEPDDPVLHQLKNHLSIVLGFCDLLLGDLLPDLSARRR
jgi:hypothetical protein